MALIFTALFFSVTLNSPANYSSAARFGNFLAFASDTTRPETPAQRGAHGRDSILRSGSRNGVSNAVSNGVSGGVRSGGRNGSGKDSLRAVRDSLHAIADTSGVDTLGVDSAIISTDSLDAIRRRNDTLGVKVSKDTLDAAIDYKADDSVVMDVPGKTITLYNKANAKYKDVNLDAYKIQMDQDRNVVIASHIKDSTGKDIGLPKIIQTENTMQSDTIVYNIKTQKAITRDTYTQSGEMFIHAQKMKKINADEYFAFHGRFTTCDLDTPHFAFIANRMKLINKKMAITGPIHPEFEGVPIPIYIPFGFFPLTQGRHSGLLPPQFTASDQYGIGLEGLGYYKVLNDYFDVTMRTNVYSYGGYTLFLTPTYRKRYHYSGQLNFTWQNTRSLSDFGKDAYTTSKTFSLTWSHQVDSKARPGTNFAANVDVASTKFNQYVLNNPTLNYNNQLNSSITYSKTWDGKYNLSAGLTHNQNNLTRLVGISAPNLSFSAPTIYPFQKKDFVGTPAWYEKFGIGLSSTIAGGVNFYDSLFNFKRLVDTFQYGMQNSIPISLALPMKGAIQIAPGVSFSNRIYSRKMFRQYDPVANRVDTVSFKKGIFAAEDMSFSLSLSTAIFGTFQNFSKKSTLMGIRHVMRPTLSISYKPDLSGAYYYNLTTPYDSGDVTKRTYNTRVSYFDGSTYGAFGEGTFGGISFGLDNHFEIKTRSKTDTSSEGIKKVTIIDGVGFNGSYNYLADSFKLSPISFYFRSTLFQKINITAGSTLDPYVSDTAGRDRNIYAWSQGHGLHLGRLVNTNLAISTSFKSKPKDQKKEDDKLAEQNQNQLPMTLEEQQAQLNYIQQNSGQFADFNIPWSLNLGFALNITSTPRSTFVGFQTLVTSSLNFSGDFNLTEKWKFGMNGYYDVRASKIQTLSLNISRDLHCWQMSINVTPVGISHFYNFTISPKSGFLQDLKINRSRYFQDE